jgi:hypothetical protein
MTRVNCLLGSSRARLLFLVLLAFLALAAVGCTPKIGDKCALSTDCDVSGGRVCDTSEPGGYCTELNCTNGSCPDDAVCVVFQSAVPGCTYNDYQSPSRTGRSFCMKSCSSDSKCRQSDGYVCRYPTGFPWNAAILDNDQNQRVCIIPGGDLANASLDEDAAICSSPLPEGGLAGETDASAEGVDGGVGEGGSDAAVDATVTTEDASSDGGIESGSDATLEAPGDTGSPDAPGAD